jgi:uncharacterized protein
MYRYPDAVIMVFCKAPVAGQVKTRLIPPLTAEEAAQLHCELTERTLLTATCNSLSPVQLWCAIDINHPFFAGLEQSGIERKIQQGKDLGERMCHAFSETLTKFKAAIIIGCDCPSLTSDDLDQALAFLSQNERCAIAPAEDGGYVLIGLTQQQAYLFNNMPWGTDKVMTLTEARLQSRQINYRLLKTQWDVDTEADLLRYRKRYKLADKLGLF